MNTQQALFDPDPRDGSPVEPVAPQPCPAHLFEFEPNYIRYQQQGAVYASPRQHQAVIDLRALPGPDLRRINADLERRAAALDREAIAILLADVLGVPVHIAVKVPVSLVPLQRRPVCLLNLATGMVERNYEPIFVGEAASPMPNGRGEPSTWIAHVPLLDTVWRSLRAIAEPDFRYGTVEELLGASFDLRRKSLEGGHSGRLRMTCTRRNHGLAVAAVDAGLDDYRVALVFGDPGAVNVARFFYTRFPQRAIYDAATTAYAAGGLGAPVPPPAEWPPDFGSKVVPSEVVLDDAFAVCTQRLAAMRPPRKYTRQQVVDFHRAYVHSASWLLLFCIGSRPTAQADLTADKLLPGTFSVRYADKATEASGERRPVLLCGIAQDQVKALWSHWLELERRLAKVERGAPPSPLLQRARQVLARAKVSLVTIEGDQGALTPLGTRAVQAWFPENYRIAENAGRHYWRSHFVGLQMETRHADAFARHVRLGTEAMSSIAMPSHYESYQVVKTAQDQELRRLGWSAFAGL